MVTTNREDWAAKARYLTTQAKDDPIEYIHNQIGYNYRLTNIQAAVGCAQLESLFDYIKRKRCIAKNYTNAFLVIPGLTPMSQAPWAESIYWMYTILVNEDEFGMDSRALLNSMQSANIQTRPLWNPLHLNPAHNQSQSYHCDVSTRLNRIALSLPCSVGLKERDQNKVINHICGLKSE